MKTSLTLLLIGATALLTTRQATAQSTLFGYDNTNKQLVLINVSNAAVTTIGASGLTVLTSINQLATTPSGDLYGVGFDGTNHQFVKFNTTTGAGTILANLGSAASAADGFEYVNSLSSLVLWKSQANNFFGNVLNTLSPTGVLTPTGAGTPGANDNDGGVYDSARNRYYTMDNNHGVLRQINLTTGAITDHAALSGLGDGAYSASLDRIFHTGDTGANLYSINAATPGTSGTLVGAFGGGRSIVGIAAASAAAPEPGSVVLLALGGLGLLAARRRHIRRGK
jgi:hypothetical protein